MKLTKPFGYQLETIERGKKILSEHGYLALAPVFMGAGKTIMTLYMAIDLQYETIIIICPKTLISNWRAEIEKHTTLSNILEWDSQKSKTVKYLFEFKRWILKNPKVFILNIENFQTLNKNLSKIIQAIQNKNQKTIVALDESTKIKCADAARTKRAIEAFPPAWSRAILTGTPITNSPLDLFTQYLFLSSNFWNIPGTLKQAFCRFRARYAVLVDERVTRDRVVKKIVGFKKLDELKSKIEYCTIQLRKEDCIDLPERIEQDVILEMSDEHRKFYETFKKKLIAELDDASLSVTKAIAKFTRLRQICGGFFPADHEAESLMPQIIRIMPNVKLNFILDDIEDTNEKIIIVANYHEEVNLLYENLQVEHGKESVVCYTGLQSIESRENNLQAFKNNEQTRFMLLNPATGAFGINLQFCSIMYFYSLPTSPEQYLQLKDRIHRIGQKSNCLYKFVMYGKSIDIRIKTILDKKEQLSQLFASKKNIKEFLLNEDNN
jgi:SNF2 family DNA or RNA helicase